MVFHALTKENIREIVDLELQKVAQRLEENAIVLTSSTEAVDLLADLGYDADMGARPLKRVIQQKVEDPLSDALLSGQFEDGDTILVDVKDGEITLRRAESEPSSNTEAVAAA
jgi:ATP-dependent Clp protease ATP-binding subunit ClpC